jgi:hypothetical protein
MKIKLVPNVNNQKLKIQSTGSVGTLNYEKLRNLPKLNGKTIIGDMVEQDPTVEAIPVEDIIRILS